MEALFHQGQPSRLKVLYSEVITVGTTSAGLNPPVNGDTLAIFIDCQDAPVRWMASGEPTSSSGHKLADGDTALLQIDPTGVRFIRDALASTDASIVVDYLGV